MPLTRPLTMVASIPSPIPAAAARLVPRPTWRFPIRRASRERAPGHQPAAVGRLMTLAARLPSEKKVAPSALAKRLFQFPEPCFCRFYLFHAHLVAAVVPEEFEGSAGAFKKVGNLLGLFDGNEGIEAACADKDGLGAQVGQGVWLKGEHGMQEDGGAQHFWPQEEHAGGDVRAVGEAGDDDLVFVEAVGFAGVHEKVGQFVGALLEIVDVEYAFGEPAEETRHALFQNVAARPELVCAGQQDAAQPAQRVLVAAGAM